MVACAGWASKLGPGDLDVALKGINQPFDPNVVIGLADRDDAGVYRIGENLALIEHLDFFTPIVDNPYDFGQIAAANALSDIYAKGGRPLTAMNIVCFPNETMDIMVLREIIRGGVDKLTEASVMLLGGHTVMDPELKYGLSVTGVVDPNRVIRKHGARPGDVLILTKPLGVGIISTAVKVNMAVENTVALATRQMAELNKMAADIMLRHQVRAATDVTGFGFLGVLSEMLDSVNTGMFIYADRVPLLPGIKDLVKDGLIPAGTHRNRDFHGHFIETALPMEAMYIFFAPETSGGLIVAVPENQGEPMVKEMREAGILAAIVGEVVSAPVGKIRVV
jgi:selenide,water dikinase